MKKCNKTPERLQREEGISTTPTSSSSSCSSLSSPVSAPEFRFRGGFGPTSSSKSSSSAPTFYYRQHHPFCTQNDNNTVTQLHSFKTSGSAYMQNGIHFIIITLYGSYSETYYCLSSINYHHQIQLAKLQSLFLGYILSKNIWLGCFWSFIQNEIYACLDHTCSSIVRWCTRHTRMYMYVLMCKRCVPYWD